MMIFRAVASNVAKLAAAGALGLYTMNKPAFYSAQIYIADNAIMPIMRKIDPETAHELAIAIANYSPKVLYLYLVTFVLRRSYKFSPSGPNA